MLPAYIDHFEENGTLYLVMEKIEGESLAAFRKRGGPFREADAIRLLRDAKAMFEHIHPKIIHRDLKPGNVIRRPDGSYAFVDFGAVRDKLKAEGGSTVVGTFGYMAPEQFQGRAVPASDVYGIGATIVAMLTGIDPEDLPHKGLRIDVRAALKGKYSDELVTTLSAMTDPDPDTRPSKIPELGARSSAPPPVKADPLPTIGVWTDRLPAIGSALWRLIPILWILAGLAWWLGPPALARDFMIGLVVFTVLASRSRKKAEERERRARIRAQDQAHLRVRVPAVRVHPDDEIEEEASERRKGAR
jgi:serine/threonine protein kinase